MMDLLNSFPGIVGAALLMIIGMVSLDSFLNARANRRDARRSARERRKP